MTEDKTKTYEEKVAKVDLILNRLDNSETPIDELAKDVKEGARLIKELESQLRSVEKEVRDAFKELPEEKAGGAELA